MGLAGFLPTKNHFPFGHIDGAVTDAAAVISRIGGGK